MKLFILALRVPLLRTYLTSPSGLRAAIQLGVAHPSELAPDAVAGTQEPFRTKAARAALLQAGRDLSPKGFFIIAQRLKDLRMPVRMIYGERDRILPDIAETARRIQADLPQAEITALPDCGHFLQEDQPEIVGTLLAEFFSKTQ